MVQRFKLDDINKHHRPKPGQSSDFSSQKPDGKNRRNDSKKIMKKSVSFKQSDVGSDLESFKLIKAIKKPKAIDLTDIDALVSLPYTETDHVQLLCKSSSPSSVVTKDLPNYMKPTRSSGAKKDGRKTCLLLEDDINNIRKNKAKKSLKNSKTDSSGRCLMKMSSLKLARNLTKSSSFKQIDSGKIFEDTRVQKPTCSSRLKDSKFPSYVKIETGGSEASGASSMEICTYKYCSLNGHRHGNVQTLKSFISDKRRSLKKKENLKLEATKRIPFRGENDSKDQEDEFLVDIYQKVENLLSTEIESEGDEELHETIWEIYEKEIQEFEYIESQLEEEVYIELEHEQVFDYISENSFKGSVTVTDEAVEVCNEDEFERCSSYNSLCENSEKIDKTFSYTEDLVDKEMIFTEDENTANSIEEKENAEDDQMENIFQTDKKNLKLNQNILDYTAAKGESETGISGIKIAKGKVTAIDEDSDNEKDFNPQEPNYLPLEKVPKSEQVDLKHQDIDERKNSEEWMVDYALRKTVTKLAPVKRKKVELLVEAFESVAPNQT